VNSLKNLFSPYRGLPKEVYIIAVARFINALGCFVFPLLTLILTDTIGLSKGTAGLYLSMAGIVSVPAAMLGGKLADSIGRKKVIVCFDSLAIALYITASFIEPSLPMVYLIILAGAAMMTAGPAHDSLMADLTTPEVRNGAYALTYMGWNLGFAVGPVVGGLLYKHHLKLIFLGDAFTALISLGLITIFIRDTFQGTKEELPGEHRELEMREEGSIFAVLLKRPVLIYIAIAGFIYQFVYPQWTFMLPIHAVQNFHELGAQYYGLIAGFNGLVVILFTPLLTKATEKLTDTRRMVNGVFLYAVGFGMLGVLNSLPFFFVAAFVFTLGEIIIAISVNPFIANHTPISHRGRMNAVIPMIMGAGFTIGPMGMGKLLSYLSIEQGWLFIGFVGFIGTLMMFWVEKYAERSTLEDVSCSLSKHNFN
jgi:MFS family permease